MPKIYMTQYCLRKCLAITSDKHRLAMEECTVNNPRQVEKSSHVNILERIAQKFKKKKRFNFKTFSSNIMFV